MTPRAVRAGICAVLLLAWVVGCSSSNQRASIPSSAPTTSTTAAPTPSGPGSSASTDPVAVGLNSTLLTPTEVQQAVSLPATPIPEPIGSATPQGPLSESGLLNVLPNAAVYKPILDKAGASSGANATYHVGKTDIDVAAIKFSTPGGAQSFVEQVINLATVLAKGQATAHPELTAGVLPANDRVVMRVPPSALADSSNETVATSIVYSNGVLFLSTLTGPPGTVTDQQVVALARAQDAKWMSARPSLGIG